MVKKKKIVTLTSIGTKKVTKKTGEKDYRIIVYNELGQVQRNKFIRGTEEEVELIAKDIGKRISKKSKIEITKV